MVLRTMSEVLQNSWEKSAINKGHHARGGGGCWNADYSAQTLLTETSSAAYSLLYLHHALQLHRFRHAKVHLIGGRTAWHSTS